jgi:hypothetical protein
MFKAEINIMNVDRIDVATLREPNKFEEEDSAVATVTVKGSRRFLETVLHAVADAITAEESF